MRLVTNMYGEVVERIFDTFVINHESFTVSDDGEGTEVWLNCMDTPLARIADTYTPECSSLAMGLARDYEMSRY